MFEGFVLPQAQAIQTRMLGCKECGYKMEWVIHNLIGQGIGMEKPKCRKCGSSETIEVDAYAR